jgi:hypothetical protein
MATPSVVWFTLVETRLHGWVGEISTEKQVIRLLNDENNKTCEIIPCRSINRVKRVGCLYVSFDPWCKFAYNELNMFEVFTSKKAASELDDLTKVVKLRKHK